ncbi:Mechanosensitive ion channel [Tangfeifania diversioriginum]|uniref:Mechanosensitive ion channel n=1 Tax=Tangfeifania diversioriginum TaxID=1168035 RepID=A0A1M6D112_9BACT|nr:mechanosensitive ion channel family protein [Tangfeifania diversioriginum]SHI66899.1 Mechanosensitive ion channel [Tangfeifania diversioriginum]
MNFDWSKYFNAATLEKIFFIFIVVVIGVALIYTFSFLVKKILPANWSKQRKMIINRAIVYTGFIVLFFIVISELNIDLTAVFGAAGIIGIVVGIASQTSIGNIVSGFFLVSEKSFEIGDVVRLGDKSGTVYSIDLLSIKIKTFDNVLIRIPNQTVISSDLTNVTRFPVRRMDFTVSVAYKENLDEVKNLLFSIAQNNPLCLDEPEPLVLFDKFGTSGIEVLFGVWFEKDNFRSVKNSVFQEIKAVFDKEGIEIPFPHVTLYSGAETKSFPVEVKK